MPDQEKPNDDDEPGDRPTNEEGECLADNWPAEGVSAYRTTDLCLFSVDDITTLVAALEQRGMDIRHRALWVGQTEYFRVDQPQWFWRIQAACDGNYAGPEDEISAMLAVIESLEPHLRTIWDRCTHRLFDLGFDSGIKPFALRHELSTDTLTRLAAVGGTLRFTLYALDTDVVREA